VFVTVEDAPDLVVSAPTLLFRVASLSTLRLDCFLHELERTAVLILVAGARATSELDSSNAMTWLIGGGFAGVLAAIVILYARMRARHSLPAT
jgi:hypothetical protein